jgi:(p)ppGpp synthase/HD superfamily hydrolase
MLLVMARTDFVERSPLTRDALAFAADRHTVVTHPIEVACLLHEAGYPDEVVAAGVLHDVLEDTDAERLELEDRFGAHVASLVAAVSEDPSIEDDVERKAALRRQVGAADQEAAAVFAADKVSKTRELRLRLGRGDEHEGDQRRLEHYDATLEMLTAGGGVDDLADRLREELDALHALRPCGV